MSDLYFEITLMLENFAKNYGVPHANYYFRVNKQKPSKDEYRKKVVEYMQHYDHTLLSFADTPNYEALKSFVSASMNKMVEQIIQGKNSEVEKRYTYYMMNEP